MAINIPSGHNVHFPQKNFQRFHSKALQNLPKLFFVWKYNVWQPWAPPLFKFFRWMSIQACFACGLHNWLQINLEKKKHFNFFSFFAEFFFREILSNHRTKWKSFPCQVFFPLHKCKCKFRPKISLISRLNQNMLNQRNGPSNWQNSQFRFFCQIHSSPTNLPSVPVYTLVHILCTMYMM
jgi:hypothetical protein